MRLPFEIYPKSADCYNAKYTLNLRHLVSGQKLGTLWMGYYATFKGAKLAVSNMFGAWFEIERRDAKWQAVRLACTELKLQGSVMPGLNVAALIATGEPTNAELVERARSESRASQCSQHDLPLHQDPPVLPSGDLGHYYLGGLGNYQPRQNRNDDGNECYILSPLLLFPLHPILIPPLIPRICPHLPLPLFLNSLTLFPPTLLTSFHMSPQNPSA